MHCRGNRLVFALCRQDGFYRFAFFGGRSDSDLCLSGGARRLVQLCLRRGPVGLGIAPAQVQQHRFCLAQIFGDPAISTGLAGLAFQRR